MNTSTLHRSSFGRIYLLTVEGFFSSLRPLLIFHAIMAVAFFGFPFLTLFLTRGFNIQEAFLELAGVYATGGVIGPYLIGTIIYILIWINKCVHKPSPGAYTQIPASAGEKMISIALLSLGYYLISLLSTLIISGIFGLCAAAFVEFSGFLIFLTFVLNFEEEIYRYTIEHPLTDRDYAWIILIFFGLIDLFLTWAIYHRLKTIQLK